VATSATKPMRTATADRPGRWRAPARAITSP
jgi:hypothetical protein